MTHNDARRSFQSVRAMPPRWPVWLLSALVASCSSAPVILPPEPARRPPPLPESARQPTTPEDPLCSPTCLEGWKRLVDELLRSPTTDASAAPSAKPSTTR